MIPILRALKFSLPVVATMGMQMIMPYTSFMPHSESKVLIDSTTTYKEPNSQEVYQTITARVVGNLTSQEASEKTIAETLATIKADGSWPDIDYPSKTITIWSPTNHLLKLKILVKAYITIFTLNLILSFL